MGVYSSKRLYAHDPPRSGTARYPHSRSFAERDIRFKRTKNGVLQAKTNLGRRRKIGLFFRTGYHFEGKFHLLTESEFSGERARTFMTPMAAGIRKTQLKKKPGGNHHKDGRHLVQDVKCQYCPPPPPSNQKSV